MMMERKRVGFEWRESGLKGGGERLDGDDGDCRYVIWVGGWMLTWCGYEPDMRRRYRCMRGCHGLALVFWSRELLRWLSRSARYEPIFGRLKFSLWLLGRDATFA
jgi:hypothetical protein